MPADWHKRVQAIRAKGAELARDKAIAAVLSELASVQDSAGSPEGPPLDYFRCLQIRDRLAKTADRTLFGGLSGAAGSWDKVAKAYEKNCEFRTSKP